MTITDDFLRGQQDCKDGLEHKPDQSEFYDRGYSYEYEIGAINDAISSQLEKRQ